MRAPTKYTRDNARQREISIRQKFRKPEANHGRHQTKRPAQKPPEQRGTPTGQSRGCNQSNQRWLSKTAAPAQRAG